MTSCVGERTSTLIMEVWRSSEFRLDLNSHMRGYGENGLFREVVSGTWVIPSVQVERL